MGDQAALQEAIQRARQLAAKITQNAPVKRPASTTDHSGPVKVTLAYEKPANSDNNRPPSHHDQSSRRRSSSRDYNRNDRGDPRDSRDSRSDSRDRYGGSRGSRDGSYNRDSRDRDSSSSRRGHSNNNSSSHANSQQYETAAPSLLRGPMLGGGGGGVGGPIGGGGEEKVEIIIPCAVIGLVIGKGGENIKRIQNESGAIVRVDPNTIDEKGNKLCTITGTKNAVEEARIQVENVIENAATNKRPRMMPNESGGSDSYRMKIPASRTGAIIGKGGETIKSIKQQSGCEIELDKSAKECGPDESLFIIRGSQDKIMKAKSLIEARLAVGRDGRDGGRDRGGMRDHHDHHSGRGGSKGVATGANAAPVGPYPDLPSSYPANPAAAATGAAGQQNPDMTAAWAAYFAQYSTLFNQTGGQPGAPGMSFPGQAGMMGASGAAAPQLMTQQQQQPSQSQQPPPPSAEPSSQGAGGQPAQDYSDQWIEFYMANGRPDYAEQIIQMKKQQQAPK